MNRIEIFREMNGVESKEKKYFKLYKKKDMKENIFKNFVKIYAMLRSAIDSKTATQTHTHYEAHFPKFLYLYCTVPFFSLFSYPRFLLKQRIVDFF